VNYQNQIVRYIIERKGAIRFFIVAVCGAADIGKSYLAKEITEILNQKGISANHLTLDSFLMNRSDRIEKGISGYDIEAYDFVSIERSLEKYFVGKDISLDLRARCRGAYR
jgi:uridine kinase